MNRYNTVVALLLCVSAGAMAEDTTYRKHVRPLWEARCSPCHGTGSPEGAEFDENKEKFAAMNRGPRMDSYTALLSFVAWPDTGALMRRLDDGRNTAGKKPGNMYVNLGASDEERQKNLAIFKAWVGAGAWTLKKPDAVTKDELLRIKARY